MAPETKLDSVSGFYGLTSRYRPARSLRRSFSPKARNATRTWRDGFWGSATTRDSHSGIWSTIGGLRITTESITFGIYHERQLTTELPLLQIILLSVAQN